LTRLGTGFAMVWTLPAYHLNALPTCRLWSRMPPAPGARSALATYPPCAALVDAGAAFVGIDSLNIDDIDDKSRPAHTTLLGAGVPICEHMTNLAAVEPDRGRLHAVPIAWVGGATFPVRAYVVSGQ
jgi:kynurenine formamidase